MLMDMGHRLRTAIAARLAALRVRTYVRFMRFPRARRQHYERLGHWLRPIESRARRAMGRQLAGSVPAAIPGIPEREGYLIWPTECNPAHVDAAIAEAAARFEPKREGTTGGEPRQALFTRVLAPGELGPDSPLLRLACDPALVGVVAGYMGQVPLLDSICLWYSPNSTLLSNRTSSQYFHIDPTGDREVKVFVNLNAVTSDAGPLTLVPAEASRRLDPFFGPTSGCLSDELIEKHVGPGRAVQLIGPPGTISFADTSSCFHLGSRPGSSERRLLHFHYVSPYAPRYPLLGRRRARYESLAAADQPAWMRSLLGARGSASHGRQPAAPQTV